MYLRCISLVQILRQFLDKVRLTNPKKHTFQELDTLVNSKSSVSTNSSFRASFLGRTSSQVSSYTSTSNTTGLTTTTSTGSIQAVRTNSFDLSSAHQGALLGAGLFPSSNSLPSTSAISSSLSSSFDRFSDGLESIPDDDPPESPYPKSPNINSPTTPHALSGGSSGNLSAMIKMASESAMQYQ